MKIILLSILSLAFLFLLYFIFLGIKSSNGTAKGIVDGRLSPCPLSPNCICSENPVDKIHYLEAIDLGDYQGPDIFEILKVVIQQTKGKVITSTDNYLAATYTSKLFRYVDDVEFRLDADNKLLHFRSASRVGHSDFGANLKRMQNIKQQLEKALGTQIK